MIDLSGKTKKTIDEGREIDDLGIAALGVKDGFHF